MAAEAHDVPMDIDRIEDAAEILSPASLSPYRVEVCAEHGPPHHREEVRAIDDREIVTHERGAQELVHLEARCERGRVRRVVPLYPSRKRSVIEGGSGRLAVAGLLGLVLDANHVKRVHQEVAPTKAIVLARHQRIRDARSTGAEARTDARKVVPAGGASCRTVTLREILVGIDLSLAPAPPARERENGTPHPRLIGRLARRPGLYVGALRVRSTLARVSAPRSREEPGEKHDDREAPRHPHVSSSLGELPCRAAVHPSPS